MSFPKPGDKVEVGLRSNGKGRLVPTKHVETQVITDVYGSRRVKTNSGDIWLVTVGQFPNSWLAVG